MKRSSILLFMLISNLLMGQKIDVKSDADFEAAISSFSTGYKSTAIGGQSTGDGGTGVYGIGNTGIFGFGAIGVKGSAASVQGRAGYFTGNVEIGNVVEDVSSKLIFPDSSEQITAYTGKNLFYSRSFMTGLIGGNTFTSVSCFCDEGDSVTGGGWDAYRNSTKVHDVASNTYYNRPGYKLVNGKSTGGWQIGFRNNSSEIYRIIVYVLCADVN